MSKKTVGQNRQGDNGAAVVSAPSPMPRVTIPIYHSIDARPIPLDDVERAALSPGDTEDGLRYASLGDLIVKCLGPSSVESESFNSIESSVLRVSAVELRALLIATDNEGEGPFGPGMALGTSVSSADARLVLDAIANRLEAAAELCERLREFRQTSPADEGAHG